MPQINCPSCRRALNLPDNMLGQQVRCPVCSNVFEATDQPLPAAVQPQQSSSRAPEPPPRAPYDEPPRRSPPPRRRDYDDYDDGRAYDAAGPVNTALRTGAAVWMMLAGILDLVVLVVFYLFVFTVDRQPPPAYVLMTITLIALVFYVAPLIFLFITAGVMKNARANGMIITGAVMAFILAFELLIVAGIFTIGLVATFTERHGGPEMARVTVPLVFLLSIAGLAISIVAGVKALVAIQPPRRRGDYY